MNPELARRTLRLLRQLEAATNLAPETDKPELIKWRNETLAETKAVIGEVTALKQSAPVPWDCCCGDIPVRGS